MKLDLKKAASESKARYTKELSGLKELEESSELLEKLRSYIDKVVMLPIQYLTVGENVRQNISEEDIKFEELVHSIRERGLLQNLVARLREFENGTWQLRINAGERRYRASKVAGLEKVPVLIKRWNSEMDDLFTGLSENEDRVNLSPLDLADAYARATKLGASIDEIAEKARRDKRTIRKYISLSRLPDDARRIILDRPDIFTTGILFNEVASRKFDSDDELRDHIQKLIKERESLSNPPIDSDDPVDDSQGLGVKVTSQARKVKHADPELIDEVVSRISGSLPVKVMVKGTRDKGRITINYASQEQLEKLLSRFQI
jgi:ParB family transcriptional regulator, chromosome partitioning protein